MKKVNLNLRSQEKTRDRLKVMALYVGKSTGEIVDQLVSDAAADDPRIDQMAGEIKQRTS